MEGGKIAGTVIAAVIHGEIDFGGRADLEREPVGEFLNAG